MSRPRDLLRSMVRVAADRARDATLRVGGLDELRKNLREFVQQRLPVPAAALTSAVAHVEGVESASVSVRADAIHVDVLFDDGRVLDVRLVPTRIRFAPRGAKEVCFRVEPVDRARARGLVDVVSAIAGAIATTLWPIARLGGDRALHGASVERDGPDTLTVDLRTVPRVRELEARGTAALVTEVVELGEILLRDGAIVLQLKLPGVGA